jgi:transcriptional regulator with XRE-family HTH domain
MQDDALARRFGLRVKSLRRSRNLSQFQLAVAHGFSLSHYGKIERGEIDVQLPTMSRLAQSFGIQLSELLDGV